MFMMAKMIESQGSQSIIAATRTGSKYSVKIPPSNPTHKYPKVDDVVIVQLGTSKSYADFVCRGEDAIYLIKHFALKDKNSREEKEPRIVKFVDQDILFSALVRDFELNNVPFIWNDKCVCFQDEKKTCFIFHVMEIQVIK